MTSLKLMTSTGPVAFQWAVSAGRTRERKMIRGGQVAELAERRRILAPVFPGLQPLDCNVRGLRGV